MVAAFFGKFARSTAVAVLIAAAVPVDASAAEPREEGGFGSNPGNLRMFRYVPAGLPAGAPLIVVLHGCRQKAIAFARDAGWLALADRAKAALLLPEQKGLPSWFHDVYVFPWVVAWFRANNQNACFNWFEPADIVRDGGEALSIRQMIDAMIQRHAVDGRRVYIVGLSAGGAMTAAMLVTYPERFVAGAIVAGVPYGCADTVSEALRCMDPGVDLTPADWQRRAREAAGSIARPPRLSIWQGAADTRVVPLNRKELIDQWTALHGLAATPSRSERKGKLTRESYADAAGVTRIESVLVDGLAHAFPIRADGARCGQPGDFVADAGVCAAQEIARFWGLTGE